MSIDTLINEYYYQIKKDKKEEKKEKKKKKKEEKQKNKVEVKKNKKKRKKNFQNRNIKFVINIFKEKITKVYAKLLPGLSLIDKIFFLYFFVYIFYLVIFVLINFVEFKFELDIETKDVCFCVFTGIFVLFLLIKAIEAKLKDEMLFYYKNTRPKFENEQIKSLRKFLQGHNINDEDDDIIDFIIQECLEAKESYDYIKIFKKTIIGFFTIPAGFLSYIIYQYLDTIFDDIDVEGFNSLIIGIMDILFEYKVLLIIIFFGILITVLSIVFCIVPDIIKLINRKYSFYVETIGVLKQIKFDNSVNKYIRSK